MTSKGIYDLAFQKRVLDAFYKFETHLHKFKHVDVKIPTTVLIGSHSSGKTSILESILGFKFSVLSPNEVVDPTSTENFQPGSKSPIVIKSRYNPTYDTPFCRIRLPHQKAFNEVDNPRSLIPIINEYYKDLGNNIDDKEIIIKVDFKFASNFTLIDLPGILEVAKAGYPKLAKENVQKMCLKYASINVNTIVYIEECSTNHNPKVNAIARSIIAKVDPYLKRTLIVFSKLDLHIAKWNEDLNKYFKSGSTIGEVDVRECDHRYYVAIPSSEMINKMSKEDNLSYWNEKNYNFLLSKVEKTVEKKLQERKVSGENMMNIGFKKFKDEFNNRMIKQFLLNVDGVSKVVEKTLEEKENDLDAIKEKLASCNARALKNAGINLIQVFHREMKTIIRSPEKLDANVYGESLAMELKKSEGYWSKNRIRDLVSMKIFPANYRSKILGGAQFIRLCADIEIQIRMAQDQTVGKSQVVKHLGKEVSKIQIPKIIAKQVFPMYIEKIMSTAIKRLKHWLKRLFDHTIISMKLDTGPLMEKYGHRLSDILILRMKEVFYAFMERILKDWEREFKFAANQCAQLNYEKTTRIKKLSERVRMTDPKDLLKNEMGLKLSLTHEEIIKLDKEDDDYVEAENYSSSNQVTNEDYKLILEELRRIQFKMRDQMADLVSHINWSRIISPLEIELFEQMGKIINEASKTEIFTIFSTSEKSLRKKKNALKDEVSFIRVINDSFSNM